MEVKPGYKTSEFIATMVGSIVSLMVMAGVIEPTSASEIQELTIQIVSGIVALGVLVSYILSRTEVKKEALRNQVDSNPEVLG